MQKCIPDIQREQSTKYSKVIGKEAIGFLKVYAMLQFCFLTISEKCAMKIAHKDVEFRKIYIMGYLPFLGSVFAFRG